jgi:hypothetical protein
MPNQDRRVRFFKPGVCPVKRENMIVRPKECITSRIDHADPLPHRAQRVPSHKQPASEFTFLMKKERL